MAISIRQVMAEERTGFADMGQADSKATTVPTLTERSLIQKILGQLYPRLQGQSWLPINWGQSSVSPAAIPAAFTQSAETKLRRIVEIGCGDGAFTNLLALLLPDVEIIGIDIDPKKIEQARATVGNRQNIKFIRANATVLSDIPCDRIIYNQCLSTLRNPYAFKKLILKTSQWLVDEGDFWIKESPWASLTSPVLLKCLYSQWGTEQPFEAMVRFLLQEIGYPVGKTYAGKGFLGWSPTLYLRVFKTNKRNMFDLQPQLSEAASGHSPGHSNEALLGFLFANAQPDWGKELV